MLQLSIKLSFVVIRSLQKIIIKKEALVLVVARTRRCTLLKSFKRDLGKLLWIAFGSSEFLNIHIFNWYKALYSASSTTFQHLDFIRAIL